MTLIEYIKANPNATNQEILDARNAKTVEQRDTDMWTWPGLAKRFGPTLVGQLDATLNAIEGMGWVRLSLAGKGLDISDSLTQDALTGLANAQVISVETANAIKAVGIWFISPHEEIHGEGTTCTESQVNSVRADIAKQVLRDFCTERFNQCMQYISGDASPTEEGIRAFWSE